MRWAANVWGSVRRFASKSAPRNSASHFERERHGKAAISIRYAGPAGGRRGERPSNRRHSRFTPRRSEQVGLADEAESPSVRAFGRTGPRCTSGSRRVWPRWRQDGPSGSRSRSADTFPTTTESAARAFHGWRNEAGSERNRPAEGSRRSTPRTTALCVFSRGRRRAGSDTDMVEFPPSPVVGGVVAL